MEPRNVNDKELEFMAQYLGEQDLIRLKNHLVAVWRQLVAGAAPVYVCIREMMFLEPRLRRHPCYARALQLMGGARDTDILPLWVDIGCAVGTDVRALRADGVAADELLALDVTPDFWNAGLQLYRDVDRPPCAAVFGDITSSDFLLSSSAPPASIASTDPACEAARGDGMLHLMGTVQVASCTAVLHVLPEDGVSKLLSKVLLLLRPGGLLLGSAVGADTPGEWEVAYRPGQRRYLHSVESLRRLLQHAGYKDVNVEVAPRDSEDDMPVGVRERINAHVGHHPERGARQMLKFSAWKPAAA